MQVELGPGVRNRVRHALLSARKARTHRGWTWSGRSSSWPTASPPGPDRRRRQCAPAGGHPARRTLAQGGRGERDEVVEVNRLVVDDVVDRPRGRSLGGVGAGARDVLDPDDVPLVLARPDHREPPRLSQAVDELLDEPAARSVHVARPDDHLLERGFAQQALPLLLGAAVLGLDRQPSLLVERRTHASPVTTVEAKTIRRRWWPRRRRSAPRAVDVGRADLGRVALGGDLGRQVDDALRLRGLDRT